MYMKINSSYISNLYGDLNIPKINSITNNKK